ncbi:MAG TPA: hypothetical protein VMZ03_05195, partial [Chitinophagaceae bacterium]|nr:hypothetical protein [Chitinophagaceae bacterium]
KLELPKDQVITDGNIEVYVQDGISNEMATSLAAYLKKNIDPQQKISFQVIQNADGYYVISMVTKKDMVDTVSEEEMNTIAGKISKDILYGAGLTFQLTDEEFMPYRKVQYNITHVDSTPVQ